MRSINEAASVTPISLLATALLSTPHGCIDRTELIRQIDVYQLLLKKAYEGTLIGTDRSRNSAGVRRIDHG